jgi:uncharacterized cupredoxin-like copper-binding protein
VLLALSTGHKLGLLAVAGVFIAFALASSFLFPRYQPEFPGRRLGWFVGVTFAIFVAMLLAVEFFAKEKEEGEAEAAPAAETSGGGGGAPKTVQVSETEFKITLPSTSLAPGKYEFDVTNDGKMQHDLAIDGPGGSDEKTPLIDAGQSGKLEVTLRKGTYDFYCSVPGHKSAGMNVKVTVS